MVILYSCIKKYNTLFFHNNLPATNYSHLVTNIFTRLVTLKLKKINYYNNKSKLIA